MKRSIILLLVSLVALILIISGCVQKEETSKCLDECSEASCDDYSNLYECLTQADGCKDLVYKGFQEGKCGVECYSVKDCSLSQGCYNTKCIAEKSACINAKLSINTQSGYTCYNVDYGEVKVMISRGSEDYELKSIEITISGKEGKKVHTQTSDLPDKNEERTYAINVADLSSVEILWISPILEIDICGVTDFVRLNPC